MADLPFYYDRIARVWLNPTSKAKINRSITAYGYNWEHSSYGWLKTSLKKKLRKRQQDRCCYCRRELLFNKGLVEIEHIVDKGSNNGEFERFMFEVQNLALSCKDCNNAKGKKPVLAIALSKTAAYPNKLADFEWVHPHLHRYSAHIIIHQGWVYEARGGSKEGHAVIVKCFLKDLRQKERKNRQVRVDGAQTLKDAVLVAASMTTEVGIDALCREFGRGLAKKWASTPTKVEAAMRAVYDNVQALNL